MNEEGKETIETETLEAIYLANITNVNSETKNISEEIETLKNKLHPDPSSQTWAYQEVSLELQKAAYALRQLVNVCMTLNPNNPNIKERLFHLTNISRKEESISNKLRTLQIDLEKTQQGLKRSTQILSHGYASLNSSLESYRSLHKTISQIMTTYRILTSQEQSSSKPFFLRSKDELIIDTTFSSSGSNFRDSFFKSVKLPSLTQKSNQPIRLDDVEKWDEKYDVNLRRLYITYKVDNTIVHRRLFFEVGFGKEVEATDFSRVLELAKKSEFEAEVFEKVYAIGRKGTCGQVKRIDFYGIEFLFGIGVLLFEYGKFEYDTMETEIETKAVSKMILWLKKRIRDEHKENLSHAIADVLSGYLRSERGSNENFTGDFLKTLKELAPE
eukprot:augustus_masked-scaffold_36-processed-gene-2.27-mRNA-1 protein AED:1.00 eAED:1.00 QI:0/-1/0/0/-1/1/1/0/385